MNISQQFQSEMYSKGIKPPSDIFSDAKLHRFYIENDKKGSKNGWYCLHSDGVPCGVFGSWKNGGYFKWSARNKENMSSSEQRQQAEKIKNDCKIRNELKVQEQCEAAQRAEHLWDGYLDAAFNHLYLAKKHILACYARQCGTELVLPIIDFGRKICSLQYIKESGEKRFLSNGAIKGHFIPVQHFPGDGKKILIAEGFSTAATLAQNYLDCCVIAACDAGNLKPVAMHIRHNLPHAEIIICTDDDRLTPGNPGQTKGYEAAVAVGALFAKPEWPEGAPLSLSDFNDLYVWLSRNAK